MEVVLQRLNVGSPPVFRLDSEPSRMHVHDPKETSAVDLADDSNADKTDFCWRSYCSRRKSSLLRHACRCDAAHVAEAVVEPRHETPNPNRSFAAWCRNQKERTQPPFAPAANAYAENLRPRGAAICFEAAIDRRAFRKIGLSYSPRFPQTEGPDVTRSSGHNEPCAPRRPVKRRHLSETITIFSMISSNSPVPIKICNFSSVGSNSSMAPIRMTGFLPFTHQFRSPKLSLRNTVPSCSNHQGSVFGVRGGGGAWRFFVQRRALVEYFHETTVSVQRFFRRNGTRIELESLGRQWLIRDVPEFWPGAGSGRQVV